MNDRVAISRRHSFSCVPDSVLEHETLSHASVRALAWALGRPEGWDLRIGYWCQKCGLTDKTWPRVKKELKEAGFFRQWKTRGARGVFKWHQEITDAPIYTTPPKRIDGASMGGAGRDADGGDKAVEVKQDELNKKLLLQPTIAGSSASQKLEISSNLDKEVQGILLALVDGLKPETAQAVLDEAIAIRDAGGVRVSLPSLTAGLAKKAKKGEFQPAAGMQVKLARRHAAENQAQQHTARTADAARVLRRAERDAQIDAYLKTLDVDKIAELHDEFGAWLANHNQNAFLHFRRDGLKNKIAEVEFRKYLWAHHLQKK